MSIVIHGNNFVDLQQRQIVQNVDGSANDNITIKFNNRYFVPGQYYSYVRRLVEDMCVISPAVNHNINPNSWFKVWKHFTNNQDRNVICCTCNTRRATIGGHIIVANPAQNRRADEGSNYVCIVPICGVCNGQNRNLNIQRNIQGVKLFDYYNSYGDEFISENEEHGIRITYIWLSQRVLQHIQRVETNGNAHYGHIERQGRQGQLGRQEQPQAGQPRRPFYYHNPNAYR